MLTVILSCVVLLQFGLSGITGMFLMAIAGIVCTALSVSGRAITGKGEVPGDDCLRRRCGVNDRDALADIPVRRSDAGDLRLVLASPQTSIMKALVEGFMSHQPVPYILFGVGVMIAITMEMLGEPSLIFALGMYLPPELNTPALVGGFLAHLLNERSEHVDDETGRRIRERGVIIVSGLMAGGALGGVFGAGLRL